MAEFIKIGNEITVKPKLEGISYELINNKVYDLEYDRMQGRSYLKENGDLNMPKKLYELEEDNKFIKRVLNYFNSENSGKTTGILLAGTKGTGKTMLSKRIALESNLPILQSQMTILLINLLVSSNISLLLQQLCLTKLRRIVIGGKLRICQDSQMVQKLRQRNWY